MKRILKIGAVLFVTTVLLLALILGGMRLLVSNIDLFESKISFLLKREISKGLIFDRVSGAMLGFNPVLRVDKVSLNLPDSSQPVVIDHLKVEFDFWRSLRERTPVVSEVSGELEKLEVTRDRSGKWWIDEYQIDRQDGADVDLPGFTELLELLPRYLKLELRSLVVYDEARGSSHNLSRVAARIAHRNDQFFIQASALLPQEFGSDLLLKSVIGPGTSQVYFNASGLQLAPVARLFDVDTRGVKSGVLDGQLWLDMSGYRITGMYGDLLFDHGVVQLADDKPTLAIDYRARFNSTAGERRWQISSKFERLVIDGQRVPGFDAQFDIPVVDDDDRLALSINRLPLSSLPVVAGQWLPAGLNAQIRQGKLQGLLQDVIFEVNLDDIENFRLGARISDFSNQVVGEFPGISKLDTRLVMGHNRLAASVSSEALTIDFGDQFRAPMQVDSLRLNLLLNRQPSGNLLVAAEEIKLRNRDLRAVGRLLLETDGEEAPFMYLRATFDDLIAGSTSKYLPRRILPLETLEWLDRGIVEGYVSDGHLQYHGRLRDIRELARERATEFFVDFRVEQANIFFAPGWLPAKNAYGRIMFHNVGFEFDIERASYEHINNLSARGMIADFELARLDLSITAEASAADALRVWRNTPVGERFDEVMGNLEDFDGVVASQINLNLPLAAELDDRKVDVRIDLRDVAARAPHWGLELSQANGQVRITEDTIAASDIRARFFGDAISVDIDSSNSAENTEVAVRGRLASSNLLRKLPDYLSAPVSGNSDWRVRLNIAGDAVPAEAPFLSIEARSDLRDTQIAMPLPFRKPGADALDLSADINFFPGKIEFTGKLGPEVLGRGMLSETAAGDYQLGRLDLAFNSSLRQQQDPGVYIHGRISELSVDEWLDYLRSTGEGDPTQLKLVVLGVDRGQAFGREFDSAVLEVKQFEGRFLGQIDSSIAKGSFETPATTSAQDPLVVTLDYLNIDQAVGESDYSELRPSRLPAVRLSSNSMRYDDMNFSDLLFVAYPQAEVMQVESFDLRRDLVRFNSHGNWTYDGRDNSHRSALTVSVAGPDVGRAIAGLGFGNSITSGEIDLTADFDWPAPLFAFGLDILGGTAQMKISDGVLNNVEPGSGRFVGLLSVSALPRRLTLDFSDVVIDGLEFDKITGSYRVADGVLYTDDTQLDGPAAEINISGKTGIIDRDYDQLMRVTPKIRQTLPLLGVVAVGTGVGWGLLVLQNMFQTVIDGAVEVEYRVTGSWDDPQIKLEKAIDGNRKPLPKIEIDK